LQYLSVVISNAATFPTFCLHIWCHISPGFIRKVIDFELELHDKQYMCIVEAYRLNMCFNNALVLYNYYLLMQLLEHFSYEFLCPD